MITINPLTSLWKLRRNARKGIGIPKNKPTGGKRYDKHKVAPHSTDKGICKRKERGSQRGVQRQVWQGLHNQEPQPQQHQILPHILLHRAVIPLRRAGIPGKSIRPQASGRNAGVGKKQTRSKRSSNASAEPIAGREREK